MASIKGVGKFIYKQFTSDVANAWTEFRAGHISVGKFIAEATEGAGTLATIGFICYGLFANTVTPTKRYILPSYSQVEVTDIRAGTEPHHFNPFKEYHRNPGRSDSIPFVDVRGIPYKTWESEGDRGQADEVARFYFDTVKEAQETVLKLSPKGGSTVVAELPNTKYGSQIRLAMGATGKYTDVGLSCSGDAGAGYDKNCRLSFVFVDDHGNVDPYLFTGDKEVATYGGYFKARQDKENQPRPPHSTEELANFLYPR